MGKTTLNQNQTKGMGAWTAFTPSWTNLTVGSGTNVGYYQQVGKTVHIRGYVVLAADSSISGAVSFVPPVNAATYNTWSNIGNVLLRDSGTGSMEGFVDWESATSFAIVAWTADTTYVKAIALSSTVPFTWTTNDSIQFVCTYEAA